MKKFDKLTGWDNSSIIWNGKEYRTTQQAYAESCFISSLGYNGEAVYMANALDENDNEYRILWEIIDHETTDESETCDWDNPLDVIER